jgi:hypothetical protein
VATTRAATVILVAALLLLPSMAPAARRACVRNGCRPSGQECARAFRDRMRTALDACGESTGGATKACRQAARRAARDGLRACRASTRACAACCRDSGTACDIAVCGNGLVEGGEACDGAQTGSCPAGCRADCTCAPQPPRCGDGTKDDGEECDGTDAATCPGRCLSDCTCGPEPPRCGDGTIDDGEACDGAAIGTCEVACDAECACVAPVCGNGIVGGNEACDGVADAACPGRCLADCTCEPVSPECGNGVINQGEQCDGAENWPCEVACNQDCTCEPPVCGNGIVGGGEQCDLESDLGFCPADQCRDDCTCEPPTCGDGRLQYLEECEPGVGDSCFIGCRADCTCAMCGNGAIEAPFEACEPTDDAACPGHCSQQTCLCLSPTTDGCEAPRELGPLPAGDRQTVIGATKDPSDPPFACPAGAVPHEGTVWYAFTAPGTGRVTVDSGESTFDSVLGVYTGACGALTPVACNDDNELGSQARIDFPVVGGTRYLIQAAAFAGKSGGDLVVAVAFEPCGDGVLDAGEECEPSLAETCTTGACSPHCECLDVAADECADAAVATDLPIHVRLAAHTSSGAAADPRLTCVGVTPEPPVSTWFRFVAPTDGIVDVETTGSDYDTVLGVFTGACGALTQASCDDDGSSGFQSFIRQPVAAGVTYTVLVTPYFGSAPDRLQLSIGYEPPP